MGDMIERVAEAMWEKSGHAIPLWMVEQMARTAFETMRTPTLEMLGAALATERDEPSYYEAWQAMIDEALREKVPA